MADSNTVAGKFFRCDHNLDSLSMELTSRMNSAAIMARMLRDMTIFGAVGTGGTEPDPDEIAALADALLAYIGFIDPLLNQLDQLADVEREARRAARSSIAAAA